MPQFPTREVRALARISSGQWGQGPLEHSHHHEVPSFATLPKATWEALTPPYSSPNPWGQAGGPVSTPAQHWVGTKGGSTFMEGAGHDWAGTQGSNPELRLPFEHGTAVI